MFSSHKMSNPSLLSVVCRRTHVLLTSFVFVCVVVSNAYRLALCFCFVFLRLTYSMLPVSLDCPFFNTFFAIINRSMMASDKTLYSYTQFYEINFSMDRHDVMMKNYLRCI